MTEHNEKKQAFEKNDDFEKQSEHVNADSYKCRDELTDKSTEILKECFDAQITKQLEENPPEIPTYEQFSAMIDKDQTARRRRKRRITGIAACFVAAILIGVFACSLPGSDVDADNNPKEEITTEDGVIIEDGGWGSSEGEDDVWVVTEWKYIDEAKVLYPQLLVPEYIPKGYKFEKLVIESFETGSIVMEYVFNNQENQYIEIEILRFDSAETSTAIDNVERKLECKKGDIYIQELEVQKAIIQMDNGSNVYIWAELSDQEFIRIVNNLV